MVTVLAASLVAGCGGSPAPPAPSSGYGLVTAQYADCQASGEGLARYFDTGQPLTDDATYGGIRQQVLTLQGDARALFIRRQADAYIQQCDQREALDDQAAAASAAATQAAGQQAAALQAAEQAFVATCTQLKGTVDESTTARTGPNGWGCTIQYPQWSEGTRGPAGSTVGTFYIPIDATGNLAADPPAQQFCANWQSQGNGDWWHADTHVCAVP